MIGKSIIRRGAYVNLKQADLAAFAGNVFDRMSNKPEYQPFAAEVTQLGELVLRYKSSLDTATSGGIDRIGAKNAAQASVLALLDRIATMLFLEYKGDEMWIINSGMEYVRAKASKKSANMPIPQPENLQARQTGIKGQAELIFRMPNRSLVRNNAVEYSADNGETWTNGTYTTTGRVLVDGLPSRLDLILRVRSMGTYERKSPWAETRVMVW